MKNKLPEKRKQFNSIEVSFCQFESGEIQSKKICIIKWDSRETPLIIAKELKDEHYHHYFKDGELVAHIKNNKTKERHQSKPGISNSISEILSKFHNIGNNEK